MTDLDHIMSALLKHVHEVTKPMRERILNGEVESWEQYRSFVGYLLGAEEVAEKLIEKAKEIEDAEEE